MSEGKVRQPIHTAVQHALNADEESAGSVVTGWVCVAESMAPDGRKWLSRVSSDASGERRLPRWTEQGLLHNALHGDGDDGWDVNGDESGEA